MAADKDINAVRFFGTTAVVCLKESSFGFLYFLVLISCSGGYADINHE